MDKASLTLQGDLDQMDTQRRLLMQMGYQVTRSEGYCYVENITEEEALNILDHLFKNRIDGWHNYQEVFLKAGTCTKEEFDEALKKACKEEDED